MRKLLLSAVLALVLLTFSVSKATAVELSDCEKDNIDADKVSECIKLLTGKITDLGSQKKTLSSQIAQFDTQIKLTQTKIADAETTIAQLEKEINVLGFRIG